VNWRERAEIADERTIFPRSGRGIIKTKAGKRGDASARGDLSPFGGGFQPVGEFLVRVPGFRGQLH
jgi:hypothetical protein